MNYYNQEKYSSRILEQSVVIYKLPMLIKIFITIVLIPTIYSFCILPKYINASKLLYDHDQAVKQSN